MADGWRDWLRARGDFRVTEVEGYREIDQERVLALFCASGRSKASGLEVGATRSKGAALFHVRDGKVTRLMSYAPRDRALADLGLAPEAGPQTRNRFRVGGQSRRTDGIR